MDPMGDFNKAHPELQEGEIFLVNCSLADFNIMTWVTKRRGEIAYDFLGNKTSYLGMYPVFVKREELERVRDQFSIYGPPRPVM